MADFQVLLSRRGLGTSLQSWLIAALLALTVTVGLMVVRRWAVTRTRRWAERTETRVDDVILDVLDSLKLLFFLGLGVWIATEYVQLSAATQRFVRSGVSLLALVQIGISLQVAVRSLSRAWARADDDGESKTAASASAFLLSLGIWAVLLMMAMSVLGFEISALVAGLGVGGVAAALAVQNILGDVFASLSIYFDRPFHIGDFIISDDHMGTVERIGLRTTRVRSLGGEEIVFANGDLTKSRIRNYKRMEQRRVVFGFGVEYGTTLEQLRAIPDLVKSIVDARPDTRFDRAHFKEYGDFSLNFEVVFYVLSPDYTLFMDHQQAINLAIFEEFARRGIQFAFPTQKLLIVREAASSSIPSTGSR